VDLDQVERNLERGGVSDHRRPVTSLREGKAFTDLTAANAAAGRRSDVPTNLIRFTVSRTIPRWAIS